MRASQTTQVSAPCIARPAFYRLRITRVRQSCHDRGAQQRGVFGLGYMFVKRSGQCCQIHDRDRWDTQSEKVSLLGILRLDSWWAVLSWRDIGLLIVTMEQIVCVSEVYRMGLSLSVRSHDRGVPAERQIIFCRHATRSRVPVCRSKPLYLGLS